MYIDSQIAENQPEPSENPEKLDQELQTDLALTYDNREVEIQTDKQEKEVSLESKSKLRYKFIQN